MGTSDEIFELIGFERPAAWNDDRETAVRANVDRLVAAILANDDESALDEMTLLHRSEPDIVHALFDAAMTFDYSPMVVVVELRPARRASGTDNEEER